VLAETGERGGDRHVNPADLLRDRGMLVVTNERAIEGERHLAVLLARHARRDEALTVDAGDREHLL